MFLDVAMQVGRTGAGISRAAPAVKLLPVTACMGSTDSSAPSSGLFPFLAAHEWFPWPWRLSQGLLAAYTGQAPSYLPGPLNRYEATKPSWLFQEVSVQQLQARLEAGAPCGLTRIGCAKRASAAVCIHALDCKFLQQSREQCYFSDTMNN